MNLIKNKKAIFIDFDGTAYNTIEAIVKLYNDDFEAYDDYKKIDWSMVETWDFTELGCASSEYINTYFNQKRLFNIIKPMPFFETVIDVLQNEYKIIFCSSGNRPNLKLKEKFIKDKYPYAEFIGVDLELYNDKSHVNMKDGIFIDDCKSNLDTSNASVKILFGDVYSWNKEWEGIRCYNWGDAFRLIQKIKGGDRNKWF